MKKYYSLLLLSFLLTACSSDDNNNTNPPINNTPVVSASVLYDVLAEQDITYAEGLSHQSINSTTATPIPLKLDVYYPDNTVENRPTIILIHGGGFIGGSKTSPTIVNMANYFAARGWVAFSIGYRLRDDFGTIPQEWIDYAPSLDPSIVSQFYAIYPAHRDAKAALRWVVANANTYNINPNYITVGGSSAGAITAITLGISNQEDYRDELTLSQDPTLNTTNLGQSFEVKTIIDLWGSKIALDILEGVYGHQRFNSSNPPLLIAHGTEDPTVLFSDAEALKAIYDTTGVPLAYYPLQGLGHGAWGATVNGKNLNELSFDFIVEQQGLIVQE